MKIAPVNSVNLPGYALRDHAVPQRNSTSRMRTGYGTGTIPIADTTPNIENWAQRLHAPKVMTLEDYVDQLYGG